MSQIMQERPPSRKALSWSERGRERMASMGWLWELGVALWRDKCKPMNCLESWLKRLRLVECVCMRDFLSGSFPWKLEEYSHKNNTLKIFTHKKFTFIEGRRVKSKFPSFPLFLAFSHCLCARLAVTTGFSFSESSSRDYSKLFNVFESRFYSLSCPTVTYLSSKSS